MTAFTMPAIPDKLSDAEARSLLEKYSPEVRELGNEIVRNNTRAEEGERNHKALMAKANEHFGVDDGKGNKVVPDGEEGVKRLLDERMSTNAQKVRDFFTELAAAKEKLAAVTNAAPTR